MIQNTIFNIYRLAALLFVLMITSCQKFLDERISHSSKVVTKLSDLQALLDAENSVNLGHVPFLLEVATDNNQIDWINLSKLTTFDQDLYKFVWTDLYPPVYTSIWLIGYKPISVANIVLEGVTKLGLEDTGAGRDLRGQALFTRAFNHFMLAQVFCLPYDKGGANDGLGIPIRHDSDINVKSKRSSIKETYNDILRDMNEAASLLNEQNGYASRANKAAAYAALSRIYQAMELYEESEIAATKCLALQDKLIDLNTVDVDANNPYPANNEETIYFAYGGGSSLLMPSRGARVSPELFNLFEAGDLRIRSYFQKEANGEYSFKGNYMGFGLGTIFCGLTTSEVLLNRAECYARKKELDKAKDDLNKFLLNRIEKEFFTPVVDNDADNLLKIILDERRKELVNRSVRWLDLRRLNRDPRFKKTLLHTLNIDGRKMEYKLPPEPENYVFKIPKEVIDIAGIEQN